MALSRELELERRRRQRAELAERNRIAAEEEARRQEELAGRASMPIHELNEKVRAESHERKVAHAGAQPDRPEPPLRPTYSTPGAKMERHAPVENKMVRDMKAELETMSKAELVALAESRGVKVTRKDRKKIPPTKADLVRALCS